MWTVGHSRGGPAQVVLDTLLERLAADRLVPTGSRNGSPGQPYLGGAQRPAAGLAAGQQVQLAAERVQLVGEPVNLAQPGLDRLPPGRRQGHLGHRGPALRVGHGADRRRALVEKRR
ncbi:MAG TPA: hypothetical protein VLW50_20795, partial [Streptosporangiaceae bacterium]|nr:hypothetical protein [Streptosporangiaceae bacterium]